jgi:hypothetical protein
MMDQQLASHCRDCRTGYYRHIDRDPGGFNVLVASLVTLVGQVINRAMAILMISSPLVVATLFFTLSNPQTSQFYGNILGFTGVYGLWRNLKMSYVILQ